MGIVVKIEKDSVSGGGAEGLSADKAVMQPEKQSASSRSINTLLIDYAKRVMSEGVNVYIDQSGDYILNERINNAMSLSADALTIFAGGWVGAVAVGYKYASQAVKNMRETRRSINEINMLKEQAGRVIELGGRFTND